MEGKFLVGLLLISLLANTFAIPPAQGKLRFIKTTRYDEGHWANEEEIQDLKKRDVGFMDITNVNLPKNIKPRADLIASIPNSVELVDAVTGALDLIDGNRMHNFLVHFSSFHTRYYTQPSGAEAAEWLLNEVQTSIESSSYSGEISARFWKHENKENTWLQQSVFVRLVGSNATLAEEVVIIGAHLDSVNTETTDETARAPGADDNGSGSAVVLETLRVLLENNLVPERTVEFHWYAAEEDGLLGSKDIANAYYHTDVQVVSMVNFDMASYTTGKLNIGLIDDDFTNPTLTQYLRYLIGNYSRFTPSEVSCGNRPCTDHAPFTTFGFPAASPVNPDGVSSGYHSERDTMELVNIPQLVEFTKLGVGYVMEVGRIGVGNGAEGLHFSFGVMMATIILALVPYF